MTDEHAFEYEMIKRGKSVMPTDPKTGVSQQYTAHKVLAFHALRSGDDSAFRLHVRELLDVVTSGFRDYGLPVHPEKQIPLLFLATAIEDFHRADELATIQPETKHSHSFDVALVGALRAAILGENPPSHRYNPTKSEEGLFNDISKVGSDNFSTSGTDFYWRATKARRYSNTVFQERNLFSESLTLIHKRAMQVGRGG